jgi:hypothetical protein
LYPGPLTSCGVFWATLLCQCGYVWLHGLVVHRSLCTKARPGRTWNWVEGLVLEGLVLRGAPTHQLQQECSGRGSGSSSGCVHCWCRMHPTMCLLGRTMTVPVGCGCGLQLCSVILAQCPCIAQGVRVNAVAQVVFA